VTHDKHTPVVGPAQQVTLQPSTDSQIAVAAAVSAISAISAHIIPMFYMPHNRQPQ